MSSIVKEGYKETEIGVIPVEWDIKYVTDIAKIKTGNKDTQDKEDNGVYPFFVRSQTIERINSYSFDGEAVLTAGDGVGVGKIYHYLNEKFDYHQRVYNIHNFIDEVDGRYFFEYFKSNFYSRVTRMSAKNSVDSVRLDMIAKMGIPLPPLEEQIKIAEILSTTDEKIEAISSQIEKAETVKKGLLQKLLSEGIGHSEFKESELGKIPMDWDIDKLENLTTKIGDGLHGTPKYIEQSDYYFINGNNLNGKSIEITDNTKCVTEEEYIKNKKILSDTTILLSINGTIGSLAYYGNEHVMLGKSVAYMNTNDKISKQFLFYLLKSSQILNYFMFELTGTTIKNLSLKTIRNTKIPLPPLKEQTQIAQILSTSDEKIELLKAKKEKYEILKKGLLQKLLSGEVRV